MSAKKSEKAFVTVDQTLVTGAIMSVSGANLRIMKPSSREDRKFVIEIKGDREAGGFMVCLLAFLSSVGSRVNP